MQFCCQLDTLLLFLLCKLYDNVQTGGHRMRALHGTAPQYLSGQLRYVWKRLLSRHRGRLRSSTSSLLDVRPSRLVIIGDHLFAAAGPRLWNSPPVDVQSVPSLPTFRQKLKTFIPAIIPRHWFFNCFAIVVLEVTVT